MYCQAFRQGARDLLADDVGERKYTVREGPHGNYVPDLTEESVAEEHFRAGAMFGEEARSRDDFAPLRDEPSSSPLRIGILSSDLRSHPIGRFLRPLLPRLRSIGFDILAYSSTPEPDDFTSELRSACSAWAGSDVATPRSCPVLRGKSCSGPGQGCRRSSRSWGPGRSGFMICSPSRTWSASMWPRVRRTRE